jgi:hypothetical protein
VPNDAKLGLVVGLGLVVAAAVVYFGKDKPPSLPDQAAAALNSSGAPPQQAQPRPRPPGKARPLSRVGNDPEPTAGDNATTR